MNDWKWIALGALLLVTNACAFKKSEPISENTATGRARRQGLLNVGWRVEGGDRSVSFQRPVAANETGSPLVAPVDFVVPAQVPDELEIEIQLSDLKLSAIREVRVEGRLGQKDGVLFPLTVGDLRTGVREGASQPSVLIRIAGVQKLLSSSEESRAYVTARLLSDQSAIEEVRFSIATPPSKVIRNQKTVIEFEKDGGVLPPATKTLMSVGIQLTLLQVVPARNESQWPVVIRVPVKLNGKLTSHVKQADLTQAFCSHTVTRREWDDEFAAEILTVPLSDDLQKNFTLLMNDAFAKGVWNVLLLPGEEKLMGLYANGAKAAALIQRGHAVSRFSVENAVVSCRSRCGDPMRDAFNFDWVKTAQSYWSGQGWPAASRVCDSLRGTERLPFDEPRPNEAGMNQCAEWELSNGTTPWDPHRFCQSPAPGNPWHYPTYEMWRVSKQTTPVEVGTQAGPVLLRLSAESLPVEASFVFDGVQEESPTRVLPGFFNLETIQAE